MPPGPYEGEIEIDFDGSLQTVYDNRILFAKISVHSGGHPCQQCQIFENSLVDQIFRGQTAPTTSTLYIGLYTAAPSDTGGGTELSGSGYARVSVTSSPANLVGTQSSGSTTASSGTGGATSNNAAITFPEPTSGWGQVRRLEYSMPQPAGISCSMVL